MYESILSDLLIKYLSVLYGMNNEFIIYKIFILRCCATYILPYNKNFDDFELLTNLPKFLVEELNLPIINNNIIYKNEEFSLNVSSSKSSIKNIVEDWHFRYYSKIITKENLLIGYSNNLLEEELNYIKKEVKKTLRTQHISKKNTQYYIYFKEIALNIISKKYKINGQPLKHPIKDFEYPTNFCIKENNYSILANNNLKESVLEKFLIKNIDYIEKDLKFIKNQFALEEGRIDLLAKDIKDNYCIIELKIKTNINIIWQCIYYSKQFKKKYNKEARIIVVAAHYSNNVLETLKQIREEMHINIELFQFKYRLDKNNNICNFILNKIPL